jgi:hypothetical protein
VKMPRPNAGETAVFEKKPHYIAVPRPRAPGHDSEIPPRQRLEPGPIPAERPARARRDPVDSRLSAEKSARQCAQKRTVWHAAAAAKCSNESHPA